MAVKGERLPAASGLFSTRGIIYCVNPRPRPFGRHVLMYIFQFAFMWTFVLVGIAQARMFWAAPHLSFDDLISSFIMAGVPYALWSIVVERKATPDALQCNRVPPYTTRTFAVYGTMILLMWGLLYITYQ